MPPPTVDRRPPSTRHAVGRAQRERRIRRWAARLRADLCLAAEILLCLSAFGPQPILAARLAGTIMPHAEQFALRVGLTLVVCTASIAATLALARSIEHARQRAAVAAGDRTTEDLLSALLIGLTLVVAGAFAIWFVLVGGGAPVLAPR